MPMNLHFSEMQGFPQPSRPMNFSEERLQHPFSDGFHDPAVPPTSAPERGERFVVDDEDMIQILGEFLEEFDDKGREVFQKFFSEAEKEIPFERLIKEKVKEFRGRPISNLIDMLLKRLHELVNSGTVNDQTSMERGVNVETGAELKHKLERFKVKTINPVIAKEDKK
ncbi:unnamed protein product [Ilex paraguariensis]|uniref:Uncharacterized protein n=1 Tax=Ilex paraguariensis TaxID=185542 RepID=A0ABC8UAW7_9AQUA